MYVFDFPLNPKARNYLKFEGIFNKIKGCEYIAGDAALLGVIRGIIDYMDLLDGFGSIKTELNKDLDRLRQRLQYWAKDPEVDLDKIRELESSVIKSISVLDRFTRQRTVLQQDRILETLKPRFLTPCGVNCFDTPIFTYWKDLPQEEKQQTAAKWLHEVECIRQPLTVILGLWRLCSEFEPRTAKNSFLQESIGPTEFLELRYKQGIAGFPMVSGFNSSINIRFVPYRKDEKLGDVSFELAYVRGGL